MVIQPRDHSEWWIDQHRRLWSNFDLWRAEQAGDLREVAVDRLEGVRLEATTDDDEEDLHLVRCPGPRLPLDVPSRALLSVPERERLAGAPGDEPAARERLRASLWWRLTMEFPEDVRLLATHEPELYEELRRVVRRAADDVETGVRT